MPAVVAAASDTALQVGQIMEIALETNASTGYQWQLVEAGQPQLLQVEVPAQTETAPGPPMVGAPSVMRLHLRAVQPGTTTVLLHYRRSWEADVPPAQTARYRVSVR